MQAHNLLSAGRRLISGDRVDPICLEILDQLSAGCPILDQNLVGPVPFREFLHLSLEVRAIEALTKYVQQVIPLFARTPGRAYAVIAELGRLVCGIPALYGLTEPLRAFTRLVVLQPSRFHHRTAERRRVLLVLGREIVLADRLTDLCQCRRRLALGVEDLPDFSLE